MSESDVVFSPRRLLGSGAKRVLLNNNTNNINTTNNTNTNHNNITNGNNMNSAKASSLTPSKEKPSSAEKEKLYMSPTKAFT